MKMRKSLTASFDGLICSEVAMRTTKNGRSWASVRVAVGEGAEVQFVSLAVFGDAATELTCLEVGAAVRVVGVATVKTWPARDGSTRAGLSVTVSDWTGSVELLAAVSDKSRCTNVSGPPSASLRPTRVAACDDSPAAYGEIPLE